MDEKKIREEIRRQLEEEFLQKSKGLKESGKGSSISKEELIQRERIRREEEEKFYSEKGLVPYINRYGEKEWLTPEEAERRKSRRRKKKNRWKQWKKYRIPVLEFSAATFLLLILLFTYKYFLKPGPPALSAQQIVITSNITGAQILLDGNNTNLFSPDTIRIAKPGRFTVMVRKPGYHSIPEAARINVKKNETIPVYFHLVPAQEMYRIRIPDLPAQTEVLVDGFPEQIREGAILVSRGVHVITFLHPRFRFTPQAVWFHPDKGITEPIHWEPNEHITQHISVTSVIPDVRIVPNHQGFWLLPSLKGYPLNDSTLVLKAYHPFLHFQPSEWLFDASEADGRPITIIPSGQGRLATVRFIFPGDLYFMVDGFDLFPESNHPIPLVEGEHIIHIFRSGKPITQTIFIPSSGEVVLEWDPIHSGFVMKQ